MHTHPHMGGLMSTDDREFANAAFRNMLDLFITPEVTIGSLRLKT